MSIEATIRARRAIHLGHRVIAKDEVLARLTFATRDDAGFFVRRLGWSAFAVDLPAEPAAAPAPAAKPTAATPPAAPVAAAPAPTTPPAPAKPAVAAAPPAAAPVAPAKPVAPKK